MLHWYLDDLSAPFKWPNQEFAIPLSGEHHDALVFGDFRCKLSHHLLSPVPPGGCWKIIDERKARLAKLLGCKPDGVVFNEHIDEDGATVFRHACKLGLEGIVSKRLTAQVGDDKSCSGSLAVFEAMFDQAAASILPLGRPN